MKKIRTYLIRLLVALLIPVLFYALMSLLLSLLSTSPKPVSCTSKDQLYISTNGVHLEIIVPTALLDTQVVEALRVPARTPYVSFGWGDRTFYLETPTWDQLTIRTALQAAFLKSETAMHVTYHRQAAGFWHALPVCHVQTDTLLTYIWQSFRKDATGQIMEIPDAGYTAQDRFFEAVGHYSLFYTCNNWVNIALKRAAVKTALWSPFDRGVLYHLPGETAARK